MASPIEPNEWHLHIEGPNMSDAILNRLAKSSAHMDVAGPDMRECYEEKGAGASLQVTLRRQSRTHIRYQPA